MKKLLAMLVLACWCGRAMAGFIVTVENDIFAGTDNNYSHGTELEWVSDSRTDADGAFRLGYGWNQVMYTPTDNSALPPPQNEHPWCGTMSVYREVWQRSTLVPGEEIRTRYEIGVLGPLSMNELSQKTVHRMINNDLPQGWGHQLPNEPMFNVYHDRYHLLWFGSLTDKWTYDLKGVYGGTAGSTFVNTRVGTQLRAGYNIPPNSMPGGIEPKAKKPGEAEVTPGFFAYFVAEADEITVVRNATVGESIYRQREPGQDRTLEPLVYQYRYGIVAGYDELSLTYLIGHRSNEFQGQTDGGMDWGMVRLEWLHQF